MNESNPFFSEISQQIHKIYGKVNIITQIGRSAQCYFTSMSNAWYLITVPNMSKITTIISEISQALNIYGQNSHYYSNFTLNQIVFDMHEQPIVQTQSDTISCSTQVIPPPFTF